MQPMLEDNCICYHRERINPVLSVTVAGTLSSARAVRTNHHPTMATARTLSAIMRLVFVTPIRQLLLVWNLRSIVVYYF